MKWDGSRSYTIFYRQSFSRRHFLVALVSRVRIIVTALDLLIIIIIIHLLLLGDITHSCWSTGLGV